MRFRPIGLFALTVGFAVMIGEVGTPDAMAQDKKEKKDKKNKNKKKFDPPAVVLPKPNPSPQPSKPQAPPLPTVIPAPSTKDVVALAKLIDAEVNKNLAESKIASSALCSDDEFLRRAYLDITGVIPSADKARAFLDSRDADKRAKLIDELLADPNYGRRAADIWTAKLFPRDSANRFLTRDPLYKWFEDEFNKNEPWNKLVTELVTATGNVDENGAVTYFLANRSIDKLNDTVSQHFLGIQLQCAQCHNHPFTSWKQTEYWGMAAFFSKVKADNPKNVNKGGDNTKIGVTEGPRLTKQKDFLPESAKIVSAKFLDGPEPRLSPNEAYRPVLAKWMTSPENPFFARALVNRTWAQLFGRGIVHPVDDMMPENEPSHPELLDALARHIGKAGEFDVKYLIKAICLSDTYQRTSKPTPDNKDDVKLFSHMTMKVMSPEQLFDSLVRVTGNIGGGGPKGKGMIAGGPKGVPVGARTQFVNFFLAGAESLSVVDYEAGIPQALRMMNSPVANNPAAVRNIVGSASKPDDAIERIYLTALSRRPTTDEMQSMQAYVSKSGAPMAAYGDILWAVLNSSEFSLVR